jgi:hypothetical protein
LGTGKFGSNLQMEEAILTETELVTSKHWQETDWYILSHLQHQYIACSWELEMLKAILQPNSLEKL